MLVGKNQMPSVRAYVIVASLIISHVLATSDLPNHHLSQFKHNKFRFRLSFLVANPLPMEPDVYGLWQYFTLLISHGENNLMLGYQRVLREDGAKPADLGVNFAVNSLQSRCLYQHSGYPSHRLSQPDMSHGRNTFYQRFQNM